jgi:FkbH-like protein
MSDINVAVSATFTAETLQEPLALFLDLLRWDAEIEFAPFGQVFQTLLDPSGVFAKNRDGFKIVLVRYEDLTTLDQATSEAEKAVRDLAAALRSAGDVFRGHLLVQVCPASPAALNNPERAALFALLDQVLASELANARIHLISSDEQDRDYPVAEPHDEKSHALGAIPYTAEFFAALAASLSRTMHRLSMPVYKVIALDCDDTLWSGVCGEDGPENVVIDGPRETLQNFMKRQRQSGKVLAIASKNNEGDVLETFRLHPEMPLSLGHFSGRRINWEPKSTTIPSLARELNLGVDSFVFVDDNPKECAEASLALPELVTLPLPADPSQIPAFLRHAWVFDSLGIGTEEDRRRGESYATEGRRKEFRKQARTLGEFLAALELAVEISPLRSENVARAAQLTQRTNQMNFTTVRRSEQEVREMLGQNRCFVVHMRDRFGDYGLVGLIVLDPVPEAVRLDTFLLSCRALGRGVEHRMLRFVGGQALERNLSSVRIPFTPTSKNPPARELLESIGATGESPFAFDAETLRRLRFDPSRGVERQDVAASPETEASVKSPPDYAAIANLRTPEGILAAIRKQKLARAGARPKGEAPRTDLETRLCGLWSELLALPSVGIHDNFFDLGGHSLLAVQLVSRLHKELNVDLPLEAVYTGTLTVAELARSIETFQSAPVEDPEYQALLAEIEGLSDEEAEALLARESGLG